MALRSCRTVLPIFSRTTVLAHRHAHAAAAPSPEPDQSSASDSPRRPIDSTAHPRKGKQRADPEAEAYRFPTKGKIGAPDPYEILGLDRTATERDVKRQYYRLALLLHPDSHHPSSSPENFATLNRAYTLLSLPQSRNSYLQTGYGWSTSPTASRDDDMLAHVRHRRRAGAAAWGDGRGGYRDSDAGRGAWGGFKAGDGKYHPYEETGFGFQAHDWTPGKGKGEERYMSNQRFLSAIFAAGVVFAWIQYHRIGMAADSTRDLLDRQHIGASHALAEARQEAALYGKERRERIRRRVREAEVLREVDALERGHKSEANSGTE
ncbi:hypothetical protein P7C73_g3541, partial [Tremellales sp. Uapishka_1]